MDADKPRLASSHISSSVRIARVASSTDATVYIIPYMFNRGDGVPEYGGGGAGDDDVVHARVRACTRAAKHFGCTNRVYVHAGEQKIIRFENANHVQWIVYGYVWLYYAYGVRITKVNFNQMASSPSWLGVRSR